MKCDHNKKKILLSSGISLLHCMHYHIFDINTIVHRILCVTCYIHDLISRTVIYHDESNN